MFIQVIEGGVVDLERLRLQVEKWREQLMPGAGGFLGSSGGVTDDGTYIAMVRFASDEQARANSRRPEQDAWWKETAACLRDGVTFRDTSDVEVLGAGGSDDAGFVQVLRGRATDPQRLKALAQQILPGLSEHRPDVLGSLRAWHDNGEFTQFAYFTSEADARAGEAKELPADLRRLREEAFALFEDVRFLDLRDAWLISP